MKRIQKIEAKLLELKKKKRVAAYTKVSVASENREGFQEILNACEQRKIRRI